MLGFLEKLTITPEQVGPHDVAALEEIGITYRAITDAVYICMGFNIINRIADAMGFEVPSRVYLSEVRGTCAGSVTA